ncbi:MAG: serine/threonine protein kinase [Deltaproteobacteria bacterium]|nr:serine/threonine protein kinase [Deltaproteobacteria bacterium]
MKAVHPELLRRQQPGPVLEPGRRLAHFTLERRVALGGMAEIWLARDEDRPGSAPSVALKVLQAEFAADPVFRAMFLDEANLIQRARHENIIELYESVESDGLLIQAMPFIDGCDLRHLVGRAQKAGMHLPLEVIMAVALPIARALRHIHGLTDERGRPLEIVHRDVTPHNVMVARDGRVLLLDFGIARATDRLARTRTGMIKGKTAYMAPEQAAAEPVSARTDIFALGIVLWELLAMRALFNGKTDAAIIHRITSQDAPSIQSIAPEVPDSIARTVMHMLARAPAARPATMADVECALMASIEQLGLAQACSPNALSRLVAPLMGAARARTLQLSLEDVVDARINGESKEVPGLRSSVSGDEGREGGEDLDDALAAIIHESRAPKDAAEQTRSDPTITMSFLDLESVRNALTASNTSPRPRGRSSPRLEAASIPPPVDVHDMELGTAQDGLRMPSRSEIRVAVEEVETVALHASALPDFDEIRASMVTTPDRASSRSQDDGVLPSRADVTRTRTGSLLDASPSDDLPNDLSRPHDLSYAREPSRRASAPPYARGRELMPQPPDVASSDRDLSPSPDPAAAPAHGRWDVARILTLLSASLLLISIVLLVLAIVRGSGS